MSNVPPSGPPNPTRQQLDELDTLLQQMLELPVNQLADRPANQKADAAATASENDSPAGVLPKALRPPVDYVVVETSSSRLAQPQSPEADPPLERQSDEPAQASPNDWVPLRSVWRPSAQTWPPLADSWQRTPKQDSAHPQLGDAPQAASPPAEDGEPVTLKHPSVIAAGDDSAEEVQLPRVPRLLRPVVAFDRSFYSCLAKLGPPGRWLGGKAGRMLLGLLGLGCLAAAFVLFWTNS